MVTPFEFATAARIVFGAGTLRDVGLIAAGFGRRALVVTGQHPDRASRLRELLAAQGVATAPFAVAEEPTIEMVQQGIQAARAANCDMVVGFGGGSALDGAKAIAALLTNPGEPLDYLEVIGRGQPLTAPSAPTIMIPTTAGTGAEVTRNAVLGSPAHQVKVSLRSPLMLPSVALVDPELTMTMPPAVTAATGLDALTQLIEPYTSNRANPLTDLLCRDGMMRVARSLRRAYTAGDDLEARTDMALASLYGGLALANARLGAVHGFAGPIGGMFPAPHGAICARLLPIVMAANVRALEQRQPTHPALQRYSEVAALLTGQPSATAADGVAWVAALCQELAVPPLSAYGLSASQCVTVVSKAAQASSMQGNPLPLTSEELSHILEAAL